MTFVPSLVISECSTKNSKGPGQLSTRSVSIPLRQSNSFLNATQKSRSAIFLPKDLKGSGQYSSFSN